MVIDELVERTLQDGGKLLKDCLSLNFGVVMSQNTRFRGMEIDGNTPILRLEDALEHAVTLLRIDTSVR